MARTWILVGDAAHARLYEAGKEGEDWKAIDEFQNPEGRARSRDFLSEPSGGIQSEEGSVQRGAMEPLSIKKVEESRFAKMLADYLNKGLSENRYDRVILVAPPELLGMLRHHLSPPVAKRVFETIAKDFSKVNPRELPERVA